MEGIEKPREKDVIDFILKNHPDPDVVIGMSDFAYKTIISVAIGFAESYAQQAVNAKLEEAKNIICELEKDYDSNYEFDRASAANKSIQILDSLKIK